MSVDPQDSWQQHFADTLREGYFLADPRVVELLAREAPAAVLELAEWGAPFARTPDGRLDHYSMGGVVVDPQTHATEVAGLYAAGEVTAGLHGANRLGGNSLAETVVFGRRAGQAAAAYSASRDTQLRAPKVVGAAADELASFIGPGRHFTRPLQRAESRGAHQRRDHPKPSPHLQVNFHTRLDTDGHLTTTTHPIPPIPTQLQALADIPQNLSITGRLLE